MSQLNRDWLGEMRRAKTIAVLAFLVGKEERLYNFMKINGVL